ncbi:MAG: hypothetical protein S4CHLAM81_13040 [Chlamydiales bacterium]|nr:hypothetical protein [Chlamydiales bacterium]MCH9636078.1 hypothetical protein [Chlamydiales bacterium]
MSKSIQASDHVTACRAPRAFPKKAVATLVALAALAALSYLGVRIHAPLYSVAGADALFVGSIILRMKTSLREIPQKYTLSNGRIAVPTTANRYKVYEPAHDELYKVIGEYERMGDELIYSPNPGLYIIQRAEKGAIDSIACKDMIPKNVKSNPEARVESKYAQNEALRKQIEERAIEVVSLMPGQEIDKTKRYRINLKTHVRTALLKRGPTKIYEDRPYVAVYNIRHDMWIYLDDHMQWQAGLEILKVPHLGKRVYHNRRWCRKV